MPWGLWLCAMMQLGKHTGSILTKEKVDAIIEECIAKAAANN